MHRTDSVDYGIVLNGEIWMLMDNERNDVLLKAGDVVVQRGTNHAWANRGTEPCTIMFVLIDGVTSSGEGKGYTSAQWQLNNTSIQFSKLMAINMIALKTPEFFMPNTGSLQ